MDVYDTIIIGGGQAGLSVGYFLRRHRLYYLIIDDQDRAGGAWLKTWDSLRLFSPVQYSSLSGWMMPRGANEYPTKNEFLAYLEAYENRYNFPIQRPEKVLRTQKENGLFRIETNKQTYYSKTLVSATGSAQHPFIPEYPNQASFEGKAIHSIAYRTPDAFAGQNVLIVGGGNSGAQILAEVSQIAHTKWVTLSEPIFLPEEVDGRYLFHEATNKYLGKEAHAKTNKVSLQNIVVVESVKAARDRNVYHSNRPFHSFYESGVNWPNGEQEEVDAIIWCTGFKSNLQHLTGLDVIENKRIRTNHTRSIKEPHLWLVGYGNWTGFASATIYGVGKTARRTAAEIARSL
ncbi:MAG: ArsO family NAD(P)H-dependent flavin-containing monooxygenase [Bacteroidota bacterium]